jgi:heterodisulfide reductase subunit A
LISKKEYLPEIDVGEQPPRVGVFICHCGINIGAVVDVPAVTEYAKTLPDVVIADNNLYTCSADTQVILKRMISEYKLNRIIVASCTPRTHEPLFQETVREAGLNKYLFCMTNIRDQCSWVHMHEPEAATEKAKDLVRMVVERARLSKPLAQVSLNVTQKAIVIGGGVSGMSAALGFAEQGIPTYLIEKEDELGGYGRKIKRTLEGADVSEFIDQIVKKISLEPKIKVFTSTDIDIIDGYLGNFKTTLKSRDKETISTIDHGIVVVATGASEYLPKEYFYGQDPRIVTQLEFEKKLDDPESVKNVSSIVMIQCVGSRNEENPYCSRICCSEAIKNALKMKEMNLKAEIIILFRDIRTYGFKEKYYSEARKKGVIFLRFGEDNPPQVAIESDAIHVNVQVKDLGAVLLKPSIVVLSNGIVAEKDGNARLSKMLKVPLNEQKFFLEAHVKLRPVDFATDGIFLCGTARAPVNIDESIAQAYAAVSRAMIILSKDSLTIGGAVSVVDKKRCTGCNICIKTCPFNAIVKDEGYAFVREALCKGCGVCGASCPEKAISIKNFTNDQIISEIHALSQEPATLE